jgi:lysozyme
MRTSEAGIAFIKRWEGFRGEAYQDSVGVLTIGYGHTMNVRPDDVITEEAASSLLTAELISYENTVQRVIDEELAQHEFDALVSLCYNIGGNNFSRSSVVRFIRAADRPRAADAFLLWCKAKVGGELIPLKGLLNRRKAEREMFLRK